MAIRPEVLRSRDIRQGVLRVLADLYRAAAPVGMYADEVIQTIRARSGPLGYGAEEVRGEIVALLEARFVEIKDDRLRILARGRDFLFADCPWDRIDEFSGGMRPG